MSETKYRAARSKDADAMAACIDAAYAVYASRIPDLPAVSDGLPEAIEHRRVWVAERADSIVGVMILAPGDDYMLLENIAVHPDASGQGIGRRLIERAEQDCAELGLREIRLSTHEAMPENLTFYSRLGWKETGRSGSKVLMSKWL